MTTPEQYRRACKAVEETEDALSRLRTAAEGVKLKNPRGEYTLADICHQLLEAMDYMLRQVRIALGPPPRIPESNPTDLRAHLAHVHGAPNLSDWTEDDVALFHRGLHIFPLPDHVHSEY